MNRTAWIVTTTDTYTGDGRIARTPPEALHSMGALLSRIGEMLDRSGKAEGTVLVDDAAAAMLGLTEPAQDDGRRQRALDAAAAAGWQSGKIGTWTTFMFGGSKRPTVFVGMCDVLHSVAAESDPDSFTFAGPVSTGAPLVTVAEALQHWHRLSGVPWQAGPSVMGIEIMHRTLTPYRVMGSNGRSHQSAPAKRDDSTPPEAEEPMWSLADWSRPQLAPHLHGYDRRRAGITAAGVAKLAPGKLTRGWRKYDGKRGGWWLISAPAWNVPEMPHPCGPGVKTYQRIWRTTGTLDLLAELAKAGLIDMPDIIDSLTGPARPVLLPWQQRIEQTISEPESDSYPAPIRLRVREAGKVVGTRGLGMLAKHDGRSTIWRPDWFYGVNATKRANGWRMAWRIGRTEKRWPVAIDDDCMYYASDDPDPRTAAPKTLNLDEDRPGSYRIQRTKVTA